MKNKTKNMNNILSATLYFLNNISRNGGCVAYAVHAQTLETSRPKVVLAFTSNIKSNVPFSSHHSSTNMVTHLTVCPYMREMYFFGNFEKKGTGGVGRESD